MAVKYDSLEYLQKGLVWALLRYDDGSEFCFLTTLNPDILREHDVQLEDGKLVRLDKKYYWQHRMQYRQFSIVNVKVSLWSELHYTDQASAALHEFL